ncbi:MAG: tripartite tricarboxylate transporter substrate binding protein [Pigmentiphaga sp.]|nr:tripartite tricarboxylate transporter substrate binding protein [Pigmentiphaga sp.]
MKMGALAGLACAIALSMTLGQAAAAYPERPIRIIVPYTPGSGADLIGRELAHRLGQSFNQTVVVENKGGASGMVGSDFVADAAPDGYTLGVGNDATHATNHLVIPAAKGKDPLERFTPITEVGSNIIVIAVHPSIPVNNLTELIEYAKQNPGKMAYGTPGTASPHHLTGVLLESNTGAEFIHVPYRGTAMAVNDLLGGQLPMAIVTLAAVVPHLQSGKVRPIAVTSGQRATDLPDLPTVAETLPGVQMESWFGMFAPAGLPADIRDRLHAEITTILKEPEMSRKLQMSGIEVVASTPDEFRAKMAREIAERQTLIEQANITAE